LKVSDIITNDVITDDEALSIAKSFDRYDTIDIIKKKIPVTMAFVPTTHQQLSENYRIYGICKLNEKYYISRYQDRNDPSFYGYPCTMNDDGSLTYTYHSTTTIKPSMETEWFKISYK